MVQGIYCYIDKINNKIIYIGKDSYINEKRRHKAHFSQCNCNVQIINKILQQNSNRYEYIVLEEGNISQKLLNALEMSFIQKYNPKFNFTKGGEGVLGYKMSEKTKNKISVAKKGKKIPMLSKAMKGNNNRKGKTFSEEEKKKISHSRSKATNTSGYYRVYKNKAKNAKNGFVWVYRYYNKENKRCKISSVSLKGLEEKVRERDLEWFKIC